MESMVSITDELREWIDGLYTPNSNTLKMEGERIADRIDAAHRSALEKLAAQVDESEDGWVRKEEGKTISTYYVDVVPRFDWELMAQELEQFAEIVRGMAGDAE